MRTNVIKRLERRRSMPCTPRREGYGVGYPVGNGVSVLGTGYAVAVLVGVPTTTAVCVSRSAVAVWFSERAAAVIVCTANVGERRAIHVRVIASAVRVRVMLLVGLRKTVEVGRVGVIVGDGVVVKVKVRVMVLVRVNVDVRVLVWVGGTVMVSVAGMRVRVNWLGVGLNVAVAVRICVGVAERSGSGVSVGRGTSRDVSRYNAASFCGDSASW